MTVEELIEALKTMPPAIEVHTEGCDCYGDVAEVELAEALDHLPQRVYLLRSKRKRS